MPISVQEKDRYDELCTMADECMDFARRAMEQGAALLTREWFEAAEAARRTAALIIPTPTR
jgi:hypothetical protein